MLPGFEGLTLDGPLPAFPDQQLEDHLRRSGRVRIAGVDEVGRGCLAGPVVAAAAVLPAGWRLEGLTDSKKMSEEARIAADRIIRRDADVGVGVCTPEEIDRWNILRASLEAMRRAIAALPDPPDFLLVDGNQELPMADCPQQTVVKGDARSLSIAAASVLAKVERDRIMTMLDAEYPTFGWKQNVGYPTPEHLAALQAAGPTPYHRRSFRLRTEDSDQMSLF